MDNAHSMPNSLSEASDQPIIVTGSQPLSGVVDLSGSKHSILHILGAIWLLKQNVVIKNVPDIWDVRHFLEIYKSLGLKYSFEFGDLSIDMDSSNLNYVEDSFDLVTKFRSSILLLASLLAKNGYVKFPFPGGDKIGNRPFAEFFGVLESFGISYSTHDDLIEAKFGQPLKGDKVINLYSQGNNRTALAIILAAANEGNTTIINPLPQPEIIDLCSFVNNFICRVSIEYFKKGNIKILVEGKKKTKNCFGGSYSMYLDKCEMGFWIASSVITKGLIECRSNSPVFTTEKSALANINNALLKDMGISLKVKDPYSFIVDGEMSSPRPVNLVVPHNEELVSGLSIDVCPQFIPLLGVANGRSTYRDVKYGAQRVLVSLNELRRFGIVAELQGDTLGINGVSLLRGAEVVCKDIRGAAALLIAALGSNGESKISGIFHINRGYSNLFNKLEKVGAKVQSTGVQNEQ